jgi:hypothetical protein
MEIITVRCSCGAVEMHLTGKPVMQYVCHCDDCQAVHGTAYSVSLYPGPAVSVVRGDTVIFTLRTSPRTKCRLCSTYLFAEVPAHDVRGVKPICCPRECSTRSFTFNAGTLRFRHRTAYRTTGASRPVSGGRMNSCAGEGAVRLHTRLQTIPKGAAFHWLERNEKARLWISPVTMAEVLEGATDAKAVRSYLARYSWQGNSTVG